MGCKKYKKSQIVIKHESKFQQFQKSKVNKNVIDLSDGTVVNFNYSMGPGNISGPDFEMVRVSSP